jgi:dihydroorotate dehydrogenase (NAD+) catalytic subunit
LTEQGSLFSSRVESVKSDTPLTVKLGRIKLANPIIACSGTFNFGVEYNQFYDVSMLGAVVTKSYSLEPRQGNPPPRTCETPCGMLNSIGLQNDGIEEFMKIHLPQAEKLNINIILSVFGEDAEEFEKVVSEAAKIKEKIAAVELNLSCPNVKKGGTTFSEMPEEVLKIVKSACRILKIPVIAKLSPNHQNITQSAAAAKKGGAEAVSLINTVVGMAVDIETFRPKLGNVLGGLSGPAVKPIALAKIYCLAREKILPIIGMGGVFGWKDVVEFMAAGAAAVGIGTVNFVQYDAGKKIIEGLKNYVEEKRIRNISEIVGKIKT